jgi:lipid-A-disaccharide synthase
MIVLFPFEEALYQKHGVNVSLVGHPSLDFVRTQLGKKEFSAQAALDSAKITVGLLPGSREKEVKTLLPIMLESAKIINEYFLGRIQFLILRSPTVKEEIFRKCCAGYRLPLKIISGLTYDGIAASDFCLVCSGSATLETAILSTPMAILYKVNFLTWLFIRAMIKIPHIGLVNVVKGKKIAEEFIQFDAKPEKICDYVIPILQDRDKLSRLKLELLSIKQLLGQPGASQRAARIIVEFLK